jgi:hypothetical protein
MKVRERLQKMKAGCGATDKSFGRLIRLRSWISCIAENQPILFFVYCAVDQCQKLGFR